MKFISIDLETTGVDCKKDKIIEFGAIKFALTNNGNELEIIDQKSFFINPGITLPQIITHITGITDEDLKNAPAIDEKAEEIKNFIGDLTIIGHNIQFDTGFLRANGILQKTGDMLKNDAIQGNKELTTEPYEAIRRGESDEVDAELSVFQHVELDTFELATILMPGLPSYSLEIISKLLNLQHQEKHRALDDAIAAMELFAKLVEKFTVLDSDLIAKIQTLCQKTDWEGKNLFSNLNSEKNKNATTNEPKTASKSKILPLTKEREILLKNGNYLYQTPAPYAELARSLTKAAEKDTYIAVPYKLFREIEQSLPDSLAKIDKPQNYISINRLENFTSKEHFTKSEFCALIKYLIWSKQTKTGLLSELKILPEEKSTINIVNIDPDKTENEYFYQKAFEKDLSSPALCTHDWLLSDNTQATIKDLILMDLESLTKTISFEKSGYIKLETLLDQLNSLPQNGNTEALKSKSTILFGLFGMLHQKYHDNNAYIARAFIAAEILNTKEYNDIRQSIKNLFELSLELGQIDKEANHIALQNWKKSLLTLHSIFIEPDFENDLMWLEIDYKQDLILRKSPLDIAPEITKILAKSENCKIVSENLNQNDNCTFIKRLYNLPETISFKEENQSRNFTINIVEDAPDEDHKKEMVKIFRKILKGKSAILFSSQKQLEYFTLELKKELKDKNLKIASQLTGSIGKVSEQFKSDPANSVLLVNAYFWKNLAPEIHREIEQLIIYRLPFEPPSDPFIMTNSLKFADPFNEFQIPLAIFGLRSLINHLEEAGREILILDGRLATKSYGKAIIKSLQSIAETRIISTKNLQISSDL